MKTLEIFNRLRRVESDLRSQPCLDITGTLEMRREAFRCHLDNDVEIARLPFNPMIIGTSENQLNDNSVAVSCYEVEPNHIVLWPHVLKDHRLKSCNHKVTWKHGEGSFHSPNCDDSCNKFCLEIAEPFAWTILILLAVKNIEITDTAVSGSRQVRRQMARAGDLLTYKILKLKTNISTKRRESESQRQIRRHFVRGHYATYDKLFGKYSGRFWFPAHLRGDGGFVQKDYRL